MLTEELQSYDQLPLPIICVNRSLQIVYFNYFVPSFFKRPPRTLKNNPAVEDLLNCQKLDLHKLLKKVFSERNSISSEEIDLLLDDKSLVHGVFKFNYIEKFDYICVSFKDQTIEKQLHDKYRIQLEKIKEDHSQIIQADKLRTIGELTAGVSHEITNPLTIALGYVDMLELSLKDKANLNYLFNVKESLERINHIMCDMKLFLHKSEDKKEFVSLNVLIKKISAKFHSEIQKNSININFNFQNDSIVAHVGVLKIEQVFTNLIKNSIDTLKNCSTKNKEILITLKSSNEHGIIIEISDNGEGINEKDWDKVFSPFFTTKDMGEGVGLGLSLSKKFIEANDGKINIISKMGPGTCFQILLPTPELSSLSTTDQYLTGRNISDLKKLLVIDPTLEYLNIFNDFCLKNNISYIGAQGEEEVHLLLKQIDLLGVIINPSNKSLQKFLKEKAENLDCPVYVLGKKEKTISKKFRSIDLPIDENELLKNFNSEVKSVLKTKKVKRIKK